MNGDSVINVSIIEDQVRPLEFVVNAWRKRRETEAWFRDTRNGFTDLVNGSEGLEKCLQWAKAARGDHAVVLDLNLGQRLETRRDLQTRFAIPTSGEDFEFLPQWIDGICVGLSLIRGFSGGRLLVLVCSTYGSGKAASYLREQAGPHQASDAKLVIESGPEGDTGAEAILNALRHHWTKHFGGDPLELFLSEIEHDNPTRFSDLESLHTWIGKLTAQECIRFSMPLLQPLAHDELQGLLDSWGLSAWREIMKCLTGVRSGIGASAAWLLALAAYLGVDGKRSWASVFELPEFAKFTLGPFLTEEASGLAHRRKVIEAFYEMCRALMDREGRDVGPLVQVRLSMGDGLRFRLKLRDDGRMLSPNIWKWRNKSLGWPGIPDSNAVHGTSRAVWEYWLASSLASTTDEEGGTFERVGGEGLWRINIIRRPGGESEVVFHHARS